MSDDAIERGAPEAVPDTVPVDALERAQALSEIMRDNADLRAENKDLRAFQNRQVRRNKRVNVALAILGIGGVVAVVVIVTLFTRLGVIEKFGAHQASARDRGDCIRDYTNDVLQLTIEFERGVNDPGAVTQAQRDSFGTRALVAQTNLERIDRGSLCPRV